MTRTTAEWEALLDGTTPGPWKTWDMGIDGPGYDSVLYASTEAKGGGYMVYESAVLEGDKLAEDLPLIAAAPDAVAEVIRLQNALQGLADWHDIKAMKARTYPAPGRESEGERAARVHETARDKITAILNGDPQ